MRARARERVYETARPEELARQLSERDREATADTLRASRKYSDVIYVSGNLTMQPGRLYVVKDSTTAPTLKLPKADGASVGYPIGVVIKTSGGLARFTAADGDLLQGSAATFTAGRSYREFISDGIGGWWYV